MKYEYSFVILLDSSNISTWNIMKLLLCLWIQREEKINSSSNNPRNDEDEHFYTALLLHIDIVNKAGEQLLELLLAVQHLCLYSIHQQIYNKFLHLLTTILVTASQKLSEQQKLVIREVPISSSIHKYLQNHGHQLIPMPFMLLNSLVQRGSRAGKGTDSFSFFVQCYSEDTTEPTNQYRRKTEAALPCLRYRLNPK